MDNTTLWQIIALVILLLLSAFFSSAETALVSTSKIRVRSLVEEGNHKAKVLSQVYENEPKMLSAILIGNNFVNTVISSLASLIALRFGGIGVSIATLVITFLILVFGEITPKTIAQKHALAMSLRYAPIILFLMKIFTPLIWFVDLFSNVILRLLGTNLNAKTALITQQELETLIDVSHEEGVLEDEEREIIKNVFDFTDAKVSQIMVPRSQVSAIDVKSSYDEVLDAYKQEHYTRYPVYDQEPDNIVGTINIKDLILIKPNEFKMSDLMRSANFTVETKQIAELMEEMRNEAYSMSVVLDEYGDLAGIVTIEDILEEIVGEVQDEYDDYEKENIQKINANTYLVKGYLSIHDLNDALELELVSEDYDSIGGIVIEQLGRIPRLYEQVELPDGLKLKVTKLDKNAIEEIRITLPKHEELYEPEKGTGKGNNKSSKEEKDKKAGKNDSKSSRK